MAIGDQPQDVLDHEQMICDRMLSLPIDNPRIHNYGSHQKFQVASNSVALCVEVDQTGIITPERQESLGKVELCETPTKISSDGPQSLESKVHRCFVVNLMNCLHLHEPPVTSPLQYNCRARCEQDDISVESLRVKQFAHLARYHSKKIVILTAMAFIRAI